MIRVSELSVRAGSFELRDQSFEVPDGRYAVLMGRTGTGKTTLLEAICGLRPVCSGRIELHGRDVTRARPAERNVGFVPQDGALFTTMTVRENLSLALRVRRVPREAIRRRVDELADLLGIGHLLGRSARHLSGGERQRVGLGRALSFGAELLCLDEPLSALDEETREEMYALIESVRRQTRLTALHVTHNRADAQRLADLLLVLEDGRIRPRVIERLHSFAQ